MFNVNRIDSLKHFFFIIWHHYLKYLLFLYIIVSTSYINVLSHCLVSRLIHYCIILLLITNSTVFLFTCSLVLSHLISLFELFHSILHYTYITYYIAFHYFPLSQCITINHFLQPNGDWRIPFPIAVSCCKQEGKLPSLQANAFIILV